MRYWLAICLAALLATQAFSLPIKQVKRSSASVDNSYYGKLELRHQMNTYYDEEDYLSSQQPSVHVRTQLGTVLYGGKIDAYLTLGAYKMAQTQQVCERRPEFEVDFYPVRNEYVTILQYSIFKTPLSERGEQRESESDAETEGTIFMLGFAPTVKYPVSIGASRLTFKTGIDAWTKLYSQKQYTDEYEFDETADHFSLATSEDEEVEDYAPHYFSQVMAGMILEPSKVENIKVGLTGNYSSVFRPKYELTESGTEYTYGAERSSYYRVRLQWGLTERVTFVNDFYHFSEGLFEEKRRGSEDRRYRNIARLTCKL